MAIFKKKDKTKQEEEKKEVSMKELYAKEELKKEVKGKKGETKYAFAYKTIIKPLITEKASDLSNISKYVFAVNPQANKIEVAKAVEAIYGVKPVAINVIKMKGKTVSRGRIKGKRKDYKKAIVSLKKGDKIEIYEGV
jgi:large subunit ribosomal protein L23